MIIEKTIYDYLKTEITSPSFYMMRPEAVDPPYYLIDKTGMSTVSGHLIRSVFAVQSYGSTLFEAASMSKAVRDAMLNIIELDTISKCTCTGEYNFTNTANKMPRYQAVFEIYHFDEQDETPDDGE